MPSGARYEGQKTRSPFLLRIGFVLTPHSSDHLPAIMFCQFRSDLCYCPVDHRAVYYPHVNFEDPLVGPQEEDEASPFEEENPEIIFSGFFSPQKGQTSFSPPSLTF
jgi:hypothetical protein